MTAPGDRSATLEGEALHVALAADDAYLPHCAAVLSSLRAHDHGAPVHAHLLHPSPAGADALHRLGSMAGGRALTVTAHPIAAERVAGLPDWGRIPVTMWYRILLPELLPAVDRVLYLDADVLVVDSLAPLWATDLSGSWVAAVTNVPERHMLGHAQSLGLEGPTAYFNSGVLLMHLEAMRRDGRTEALLACARERSGELLWPDQDALNLVLGARRRVLHPRWNVMNSVRRFAWAGELLGQTETQEAIERPAIVHFEGPRENKPWHVLCENPYRERYLAHRRDTPWPHVRREGRTPAAGVHLLRRRVRAAVRA
ncbi:MAG TPA: glycosyltransferase family 8 protein [Solirubrobacteraceae bacterium]